MYASSSLSNAEADLGGDLPRPPLPRPPRAAPLPLPLPLTAPRPLKPPLPPPRVTPPRPPRAPLLPLCKNTISSNSKRDQRAFTIFVGQNIRATW